MAERASRRRKRKDGGQVEEPTDEETAVGKHLRFNLTTKTSNFMGHKVEYFTGSKAVDMMLDSKWASGKGSTDVLFTDRASVVHYLDRLLQKGMFHRALKVVKKNKKEDKKEKETKKEEKVKVSKKEEAKAKKETKEKADKDAAEKQEEGTPKAKKGKDGKRKIKLEPTEEQVFRDGNDAYVWIFDPIKPMYYVYGLLLVVGAIAVCLFPLWPPWMRAGTYYLSLGGAGVVGSVLVLAIVRFILFTLVWGVTMGKVYLWIFPNLLADVGVLESFQPTYECTVNKPDTTTTTAEKEEEEDATKTDQRDEETAEAPEEIGERPGNGDKKAPDDDHDDGNPDDGEDEGNPDDSQDAAGEDAEEESTGSRSSSNLDNREEFEFINPDDVSAASAEP